VIELSEFLVKLKDNSILHKGEQLTNLFSKFSMICNAVILWISQIPAIYKSFENLTFEIDFKNLL
jgi:hypothetical protein